MKSGSEKLFRANLVKGTQKRRQTEKHLYAYFDDINPLVVGKVDLRLLQFAQKIVQMVFLT